MSNTRKIFVYPDVYQLPRTTERAPFLSMWLRIHATHVEYEVVERARLVLKISKMGLHGSA